MTTRHPRFRARLVRRSLLLGVVLSALLSSTASAAVRLISISSPVRRGAYVSLSVRASGSSHCAPRVHYRSKPALRIDGLATKGTLFGGIVRWNWRMPTHAIRGRWTVDVMCGAGGTLRTTFVVL